MNEQTFTLARRLQARIKTLDDLFNGIKAFNPRASADRLVFLPVTECSEETMAAIKELCYNDIEQQLEAARKEFNEL